MDHKVVDISKEQVKGGYVIEMARNKHTHLQLLSLLNSIQHMDVVTDV